MPRLVAQSPEFAGTTFELTASEITVGRVSDNMIQVEHASVSGHHAIFRVDGTDYIVRDLDSTNGTRINGERITEQKLRRNDILRLGNIELLYDSEHAPAGQPMPAPSQRVNLGECAARGKPANFANASPVGKKIRNGKKKTSTLVLIGLALLAVLGIAYFVWNIFLNAPMVS